MILDGPRFAHLPLDGILGSDFILSNFFGEFRNNCCNNSPSYSRFIIESQSALWRPYLYATSNHWATYYPIRYNWPAIKILPQLLK